MSKFEKSIVYIFSIFILIGVARIFYSVDILTIKNLFSKTNFGSIITTVDTYYNEVEQVSLTTIGSPPSVTFKIAGDFMFARGVHRKFNNNKLKSLELLGYDFFTGVDASVVNLEGVISKQEYPEIAGRGSYKFVFPRGVLSILSEYEINTVSLANNHSLNNGEIGFKDTKKLLAGSGINSFGGPTDKYVSDISVLRGHGLNIVFIGVHLLYQSPDITGIIREYKLDKDNRVVVMPHWGVEYETLHNERQEIYAHKWIDAGADLVVGAHPHVVQDVEIYKNVPIYYSLGNFLFDQTEENTGEKGVQDGLVLAGEFIGDELLLREIKVRLVDYQVRVVD
jgi:poly-gamma-glutamate synthesis protein (capsule biosynthesis protein)